MKDNVCSMCNEISCGGINILDNYICKRCEEEIIKEDLNELRIEYYRNRIKSLWKNKLS